MNQSSSRPLLSPTCPHAAYSEKNENCSTTQGNYKYKVLSSDSDFETFDTRMPYRLVKKDRRKARGWEEFRYSLDEDEDDEDGEMIPSKESEQSDEDRVQEEQEDKNVYEENIKKDIFISTTNKVGDEEKKSRERIEVRTREADNKDYRQFPSSQSIKANFQLQLNMPFNSRPSSFDDFSLERKSYGFKPKMNYTSFGEKVIL